GSERAGGRFDGARPDFGGAEERARAFAGALGRRLDIGAASLTDATAAAGADGACTGGIELGAMAVGGTEPGGADPGATEAGCTEAGCTEAGCTEAGGGVELAG